MIKYTPNLLDVKTNKMSQQDNTLKYALFGVGALALAGFAYYLAMDDGEPTLDTKKFTKDRLKKFLAETSLEFTCIYCRNYNLMLKV